MDGSKLQGQKEMQPGLCCGEDKQGYLALAGLLLMSLCDAPTGRAEGPDPEGGAAGEVSGQLFSNFGKQRPQPR